jgi:hypothetical protein
MRHGRNLEVIDDLTPDAEDVMHYGLLILLLLASQSTQPANQSAIARQFPPLPDMTSDEPDYFAWVADRVAGDMPMEENAAPLYLELFGRMSSAVQELGFKGFRTDRDITRSSAPAPWDPEQHPEWEESYRRSQEAMQKYARAAAKPFALFPFFHDEKEKPEERLLYYALTPYLPYMRTYSMHLSEMAWRAPGGRVSAERLIAACRTSLQVARQVERMPLMRTHLAGGGLRVVAYEDLRYALRYDVFSAGELADALRMLEAHDALPPPLSHCLAGEAATIFDMVRAAADRSRPPLGKEHIRDALSLVRSRQIDARETVEHVLEYLVEAALFAEKPYAAESRSLASNLEAGGASPSMLTKMVFPDFSQLYSLDRRVRAERAGTRLLLHLHAFHKAHGRWPATLDELPADAKPYVIDPYRNGPFIYRLTDGQPLLYSVGADAEDNGGAHDWQWGEYWRARDYVLWPIPDRPIE